MRMAVAAGVWLVALALTVTASPAWQFVSNSPKAGGLGEAVTSDGQCLYILRAASTGEYQFWSYDPGALAWTELAIPPERPKSGTALAWDGADFIYALLGAAQADENRDFFYRYSISLKSWELLKPTGRPQGAGNALAWSGYDGRLYALVGSAEHGRSFRCYVPQQPGAWVELAPNPSWGRPDDGAALAWDGGEWLYALLGETEEKKAHWDFAAYHVPTQLWNQGLQDLPTEGGTGDGGSLLSIALWLPDHAGYIFAVGGGSALELPGRTFSVYDVREGVWDVSVPMPCPIGSWDGSRLAFASGHVFYWQGAPTTWECGGDALYMLTELPVSE